MNKTGKEKSSQKGKTRSKKHDAEEGEEKENESKQEEGKTNDIFETLEERFLKKIKKISEIELPKVNVKSIITGVDKVYKSIKDYDKAISGQANVVSSKVVEYVKKSIKNYGNKK